VVFGECMGKWIKPFMTKINPLISRYLNSLFNGNFDAIPSIILNFCEIATPKNKKQFYTLKKILDEVAIERIEGDIIECGVYRGATLLGMGIYSKKIGLDKKIYGLDSFQGFPDPSDQDKLRNGEIPDAAVSGYFGDTSYQYVFKKIQCLDLANITLVRGYFEESLPKIKDQQYCLVHLDCDLYNSYKTCLEYLYNKVLPGGYIIFDEYDYSDAVYPGAKKAIDEFLMDKPEHLTCFSEVDAGYQRYFIKKLAS
jgi:hypothetical protein